MSSPRAVLIHVLFNNMLKSFQMICNMIGVFSKILYFIHCLIIISLTSSLKAVIKPYGFHVDWNYVIVMRLELENNKA